MSIINQQNKDYKWFCNNITKLFFDYGYSYLAIKNKKILGKYDSMADGYNDMNARKEKVGTYIIQRCAPNNEENIQCVASMNFI